MSTAVQERIVYRPIEADPFFYGFRERSSKDAAGNLVWDPIPLTEHDVLFPQEGDHISQSALHEDNRGYLKSAIRWRLSNRPGMYCLSDHLIDFEQGFPALAPDLIVYSASRPWDVNNAVYPAKKEKAAVHFIIELTSPSTRNVDLDEKVEYYQKAGVPLYVILDKRFRKDEAVHNLMVYRGTSEGMFRIPLDQPDRIKLPVVDLWFTHENGRVVLLMPDGSPIPDYSAVMESANIARAEKEKALAETDRILTEKDREKSRADALARELAELKAKMTPP